MSVIDKLATDQVNVFAELELPDPELAFTKAELAFSINEAIQANGWNDAEAGRHLGLTTSEAEDLAEGRLSGFSTDTLFGMLTRLNYNVGINLEPNTSPSQPGRVTVNPGERLAADSGSHRPEAMRFD